MNAQFVFSSTISRKILLASASSVLALAIASPAEAHSARHRAQPAKPAAPQLAMADIATASGAATTDLAAAQPAPAAPGQAASAADQTNQAQAIVVTGIR